MSVELFRVVDRVDREDQGHHVDRADRVDHAVLVDHVDRVDRADRAILVDRVDCADRVDRAELVDRVDRVDRAVHVDRVVRVDHVGRIDYFIADDIVDVKVDTNVKGTTYMIAEDIVTGDDDNVSDDVTGVADVFGELGKLVILKHITY